MGVTVGAFLLVVALGAAGDAPAAKDTVTISVLAVQATQTPNDDTETAAAEPRRNPGGSNGLRKGFANGVARKTKPKDGAREQRFDAGLESIREAVTSFPFDTYRKLSSQSQSTKIGEKATFTLSNGYTLHITPIDRDDRGRTRVKADIQEQSRKAGQPVERDVVHTTSAIAPGKHLLLSGLPLSEGQLMVFVTIEP